MATIFQQKLTKVKCGKCQLLIPLRQWREHSLQHTALKVLRLEDYPSSFLVLTQHYCGKLEQLSQQDTKGISRLTAAYDALKMLYFKEFKEAPCPENHAFSPELSPSFNKMTQALAPQNFDYTSSEDEKSCQPPTPYSYAVKVEQLQENIFRSEEMLQEIRQSFLTAEPATPSLDDEKSFLWGCALFEGLKGNTAAKHVSSNYWKHVRAVLAGNAFPSPPDIRSAMKRSLHQLDVSLKQGHEEVGQSRWSGVTGCVCILQTLPQAEPDEGDSRPSTNLSQATYGSIKGNMGVIHVANIGSVTAVLCRDKRPKRITYIHTAHDKTERQRVLDNGAAVSSHGQVNCVTSVTRALGFHGDVSLRQCLSQKPYCSSVPLYSSDEFVIIANASFWKYMGEEEACSMCRCLLYPSLRKLVHIFTTLPDQVQEEALSQTSTLDYDALVSDFGDNSQDSSMIPDDESESAAGEEIDWADLFDDPIENLTVEEVCKMLSEHMSECLVSGVREAGAVGPISCSVLLLQGALDAVKKRLLYEQAIHELKKRYNDYALSEVSLMSGSGEKFTTINVDDGPQLPAPSMNNVLADYEPMNSPISMLSHQHSTKSDLAEVPQIAEHLTLDSGDLVFQDNHGVLKLTRYIDNHKYQMIDMGGVQLDNVGEDLTKQEKRDAVREMIDRVVLQNTSPEPPPEQQAATPSAAATPAAAATPVA